MVRIKDIAEKAKVAPSTVSNVLNGTKYVSPEVKERVCRAVDELTYRPNLIARSLRTRQTKTIGVMIPEFKEFFTDIVSSIEGYLYDHGYSMIVSSTAENAEREKQYLETLAQKAIDGLILFGMGQNSDKILEDYPVPVVTVDRPVSDKFPSITINNEYGGYIATKHLLERGARHIAVVTGSCKAKTNELRLAGYRRALKENGIEINSLLEKEVEKVNYEEGCKATEELLSSGQKIDGIFCDNGYFAIGAMKYLLGIGVKVPEEIKVVGFDGGLPSEVMVPGITTVSQPKRLMGEKAAELMLRLIKEKTLEEEEKYIELEVYLKKRGST